MADERITTRELSDGEIEDRLIAALRDRGGQGSETDLVVASGLAPHHVAPGLRRLLVEYRSHLDVTNDGTILYRFDPRIVRRSARPGGVLRTALQVLWGVFVVAFKVMAGLALLICVGIFALLFVALLAGIYPLALIEPIYKSAVVPGRLRRTRDFLSANVRKISASPGPFSTSTSPSALRPRQATNSPMNATYWPWRAPAKASCRPARSSPTRAR